MSNEFEIHVNLPDKSAHMSQKKNLYQLCQQFVEEKRAAIKESLASLQSSLENEERNSAGDKYETGRSMLHLEMEKTQEQLDAIREMRSLLESMDLSTSKGAVKHGSLVITDQGNYFIAISAGKLQTDDGETCFAVSPSSPIGNLLLGKEKGDSVTFGERKFLIQEVL